MTAFVALATRTRIRLVTGLVVAGAALAALPAASLGAGPGTFTQADVNAAIANGVSYLDANQNVDGSWGSIDPGAETALALASYGVLDNGSFANLSATQQARVQAGVAYLLGTQGLDGSFNADGLSTYDTGLALTALSLSSDVPTTPTGAIPTAIANARAFLVGSQQVPPQISCQSTGVSGSGLGGQNFCGGWNYTPSFGRSDESNTGFALTGLDLTGGVPADVAAANVGWQRNVQQLTASPGGFAARNDGGGSYSPGSNFGSFSSNANDTGSLLFGFGYDGVPASDPAVQAAITFGNDVFDTYELNKATPNMVYHTGTNEDGSCVIGVGTCDWAFSGSEGGYHYSIFALVKGLSQYVTPNLSDPTNFYAKAVDLLLTQQGTDGSWPADGRDDASTIAATGFAILALGRVGTPEQPIAATATSVSATEGQSFTGTVATFTDPDPNAPASEYSATITWGDGSTSTGTISGSAGGFTVTGTHTFAEEGPSTAKVTITDVDNTPNASSASSPVTVADAALSAKGATKLAEKKGKFKGTVATFTDADPGGTKSDYTASISWGDGSTTSGTVTGPGTFFVGGSHHYRKTGTFHIKVTIKDQGGSTATATATIKVPAPPARGSAKLSGVPSACTLGSFVATVTGKRISRVAFRLDGTSITGTRVHRGTKYRATVTQRPGKHHLTVKVTFVRSAQTRARTFTRTVSGCVAKPRFTG